VGEAADVVDVIQSQVEALQVREVPEKTEISPKSPIHIEFYVGPIFDQAAGPLQLSLRQGLIELDHPTGGLERLERIAKSIEHTRIVGQHAPAEACRAVHRGYAPPSPMRCSSL
jgi:hypothetical protein